MTISISRLVKGVVCAVAAALSLSAVSAQSGTQTDYVYVQMSTSKGDIVLELDRKRAPITVANFLSYADKGHYNGTIFHRVINNFMIQGGGFTPDLTEKPTDAPIKNEWTNGLKNKRGTIAMARTTQPDTATSQFFINVVDNAGLDLARPQTGGAGYAVFGKVIQGMDVVDAIKAVPVHVQGPHEAVPVEPVTINSVTRVESYMLEEAIKAARAAELKEREATYGPGWELLKGKEVDVSKGVFTDSGLWYVDTKLGEGEAATPTNAVTVHYTGWLTDGTKFDSSLDRGEPSTFSLQGVIKGWTEGVSGMRPGGKRYLIIPPELGYGARGSPPRIAPNSMLVFEIELIALAG